MQNGTHAVRDASGARVLAIDTERRFAPGTGFVSTLRRVKIVACGEITPSQPPDMTNDTCSSTSSGERFVCRASVSVNIRCANGREKSFTLPLPSVFAITPTTSSARTLPSAISASSPDMSSGAPIVNLCAVQCQAMAQLFGRFVPASSVACIIDTCAATTRQPSGVRIQVCDCRPVLPLARTYSMFAVPKSSP